MFIDRKCLFTGTVRTHGRGVPACVIQQKQTTKAAIAVAKGTMKAAVLMNDAECPNLLCISIYDQVPVHTMTMVQDKVEWVKMRRKVYNKITRKPEMVQFWRLGVIDHYNKTMGHVDVADQLRNYYRIDKNMRNRKYWWAHYHWSIGVMATNCYIIYRLVNDKAKTKTRLSHLDFQMASSMACFSHLLE